MKIPHQSLLRLCIQLRQMKLSILVEISVYACLSNVTDMIQLKSPLMDRQCLHLLSCCCDKNPGQKHSQERGVHFAHLSRSQSVVEGSQGRGSGRAGTGRPKLTGDDWGILLTDMLAMACSVCLFIPPKTSCPAEAPPTVRCVFPWQTFMEKMPHRLAYR